MPAIEGIKIQYIEQDFMLSEKNVDIKLIRNAIDEIGNANEYIYKNAIIEKLQEKLTV